MVLAGPFFFRVRDALFLPPPNRKIKHARFAGGAFPQTRASPRPLRGKSIENSVFSYFPLARRAVRFFPSLYNVFSFRSLAALPGRAPIITPFNVVSSMRGFGASAKRGEKGKKIKFNAKRRGGKIKKKNGAAGRLARGAFQKKRVRRVVCAPT